MAGVKVLVTTDGSNLSDKAIDTAIDLTKQLGGELIGMTSVVGEAPTGGFEAEDAAVRDRLAAKTRDLLNVSWCSAAIKEAGQKWLDTMNDGEANGEAAKAYIAALEDGLCTVDLSQAFLDGLPADSGQARLAVYALVNTLAGVDGVEQVQLLVEGAALGQPLSPDQSLAAPNQAP